MTGSGTPNLHFLQQFRVIALDTGIIHFYNSMNLAVLFYFKQLRNPRKTEFSLGKLVTAIQPASSSGFSLDHDSTEMAFRARESSCHRSRPVHCGLCAKADNRPCVVLLRPECVALTGATPGLHVPLCQEQALPGIEPAPQQRPELLQ